MSKIKSVEYAGKIRGAGKEVHYARLECGHLSQIITSPNDLPEVGGEVDCDRCLLSGQAPQSLDLVVAYVATLDREVVGRLGDRIGSQFHFHHLNYGIDRRKRRNGLASHEYLIEETSIIRIISHFSYKQWKWNLDWHPIV